ncbi:hypothetical protein [Alicyclobacillus macrosporangiidus]|uniref:TrbL/VirB6 plasmid conjugal transfer protein n=1 Tax=Alicyclobacillus macrosporangiidus TaxID=392015 RepID=A0A1I7LIH7_9BACL|nr:hypothetical protein [Alicyclobacillus macrosporangiidus]SFV09475.1 hypothetical protein SAMN05421543_1602 [Alicyclobacillus macrosporangiidus]
MDTTTALFTAPNSPFPGWQNPAPNVYTFTLPAQGWWNTLFGGGAMKELANFLANLVMQAVAWVMHLAILLAAQFSDPAWVVGPVADRIGAIFHLGYENIFLRLLPFLVLATALYVVWQFLRAQHTKILTAVVSTALSGALIYVFFFDFAPVFKTVNNLAQAVTTQLGTAVESTAGLKAGTLYDALWNVYVLEPWEAAQFGHASQNLSDFNVSAAAVGQTYTNDQGQQQTIGVGDNWVKLFMTNKTDKARQSLLGAMTSVPQPFAHSGWTSQDVQNANPYDNIIFLLVLLLLAIPCLAFLGMMAFLLFALALMFLLLVFLGIVTVPVAFVPEVGWVMTLRWLREAAGYLLLRLANVVYMAATFALAQIVVGAVAVTGDESSLVLAALTNALVFLAALLFREKVFHAYIRPHVEAVQGIERNNENETRPEAQGGDTREERTAGGASRPRRGTLSGRFGAERGATAEGVGMSGIGASATAARTTGAGATSGTGTGPVRQKLAAAFATVVDKARNPSRASTWQERAQNRADSLVALERAAHGRTLDALAHGGKLAVRVGRSFYDSASSPAGLSDLPGDPPPSETQATGEVDAAAEQGQALRSELANRTLRRVRQMLEENEDDSRSLSEAFDGAPAASVDVDGGQERPEGPQPSTVVDQPAEPATVRRAESRTPEEPAGQRPLQSERAMRRAVPVSERPDTELEDHRLAEGFSTPQPGSDTTRGVEPAEPVRGETTSSGPQECGEALQASGGESASHSVGSAQQHNSGLQSPPRSGREETERRDHERRGSEAETPRLGDGFGVPGVTGTENAATMQTGRDQSQPDNAQPSNSRNGDEKIRRQSTPRSLPTQQTSTLPPDPRGPRLREPRETRGPREPRGPRPRA